MLLPFYYTPSAIRHCRKKREYSASVAQARGLTRPEESVRVADDKSSNFMSSRGLQRSPISDWSTESWGTASQSLGHLS
jgi:hypothetical protein